jgi:arylsulfatase A
MTIDILPTLAHLAGVSLPKERIVDGRDIWPLVSGEKNAKSPHEALYIYWGGALEAVRSGRWKLHLPHEYRTLNGKPGGKDGRPTAYANAKIGTALFDLEADRGETRDVSAENPEELRRMLDLAERAREDLGDTAINRMGKNVRPPGRVP